MATKWPIGMKGEVVRTGVWRGHEIMINPKVSNFNDFFVCVFSNLIIFPLIIWICGFFPLSWLFWGLVNDLAQTTQTDGTDSLFLLNEVPTSREKIFWGKLIFLTSFLTGLYLFTFALPLSLLLWKTNYFQNFTGLYIFLFLGWNFLITPLLFFVPLVILLSSLASLGSRVSKWFVYLSASIFLLILFFIFLSKGGKVKELLGFFWDWLRENCFLISLAVSGGLILFALFMVKLAYKKFRERDFV